MQTLNEEINKVREERKKEMSLSRQRNAEVEENLQESARGEKDELRRQVELLKVEVDFTTVEYKILYVNCIQCIQVKSAIAGFSEC